MFFIEFDCSLKIFYILGNGMFYFLSYYGRRDLYSLMFSMILTIIISLFLIYYNKKSNVSESINSLTNILIAEEQTIEEDKTKELKGNKKIDKYLGFNKMKNKCFSYGIVFLLYLILNIFPFLNSLYKLTIKSFYEFLSLVAMILTYFLFLHEKLFRHHLVGLFIIIIFSILIVIKQEFDKNKNFIIFNILFWTYNGAIQCFTKIMMINYYVNPYIVSIANASMQILLDLSKILTDKFINPKFNINNSTPLLEESYYNFSKYQNFTELKQSIYFVIGNSGNVILNSLIVYYYPPFIYPASNDIGTFIDIIYDLFPIIATICF